MLLSRPEWVEGAASKTATSMAVVPRCLSALEAAAAAVHSTAKSSASVQAVQAGLQAPRVQQQQLAPACAVGLDGAMLASNPHAACDSAVAMPTRRPVP